jgi:hypothetical protein
MVFIALKNPLLSAGLEPANLIYNVKHDNHYTTEDDDFIQAAVTTTRLAYQKGVNLFPYKK